MSNRHQGSEELPHPHQGAHPEGLVPAPRLLQPDTRGDPLLHHARRKFLLDCRNSPLARTPPCCLPQIPGVTVPATHPMGKLQDLKEEAEEEEKDIA
ncbi:hypothetical protein L3Q82_020763, partial [Scortum barcoo]